MQWGNWWAAWGWRKKDPWELKQVLGFTQGSGYWDHLLFQQSDSKTSWLMGLGYAGSLASGVGNNYPETNRDSDPAWWNLEEDLKGEKCFQGTQLYPTAILKNVIRNTKIPSTQHNKMHNICYPANLPGVQRSREIWLKMMRRSFQ